MLAKLGEKVPSNYILTNYGLGVLYKGLQDLNP